MRYLYPALLIISFIWSLVWVYRDAYQRGKSGLVIVLLAALSWPIGLLLWMAARPPQRILRVVPFSTDIDCPKCGLLIRAGKTACINCGYQSQEVTR